MRLCTKVVTIFYRDIVESYKSRRLEMYVDDAETRTSPPPAPSQGIKVQRVPGWIRWPIRLFFLPFIWLEILAQKIARLIIKTPNRQEGECLKRGNCCYYIIMPEPKGLLLRISYFWHTEINGFFFRDRVEVEDGAVYVMGCRYLNKDGSCRHHRLRPTICREWPRIEYFGRPRILKGCGYRAVPRKGE